MTSTTTTTSTTSTTTTIILVHQDWVQGFTVPQATTRRVAAFRALTITLSRNQGLGFKFKGFDSRARTMQAQIPTVQLHYERTLIRRRGGAPKMKVEVLGFSSLRLRVWAGSWVKVLSFLRLQGLGFRAQNPHSKGLELVAYYRALTSRIGFWAFPLPEKNLDPNALALHGWRAAM